MLRCIYMLRYRILFLLVLLVSLAQGAQAADTEVPAGFAPGPVWLSQSDPIAGNTVRLYTVVYNSSPTAIEGSVTFAVGATALGSIPFSLDAGESAIKSVTWTAQEGTHEFSAHISGVIERGTKVTATVERAATTPLSITILPAPPKPIALEAVDTAEAIVASSTPTIASVVSLTTAATESMRKAGESYLASLTNQASSTSATSTSTPVAKTNYTQKAAAIALPLFRYPALFYPFFLLLILLVLWVVAKKLRNPKKR